MSQTAQVYSLPKDDFVAIQRSGSWWKILEEGMDKKLVHYSKLIYEVL
jgi:hypothetical protein